MRSALRVSRDRRNDGPLFAAARGALARGALDDALAKEVLRSGDFRKFSFLDRNARAYAKYLESPRCRRRRRQAS